jgi:pre-mRNA-splicing factor ATP-dependent RNA helicase DHX15/PRP43
MTKTRKLVEESDSEVEMKVEKKIKKDKKHKKDKKDKKHKKDKKDKKDNKEKAECLAQHPEILVHDDAGSDVKGEDSEDSGASGEFVKAKLQSNSDYKELLFGERKRTKSGMSDEEDATVNPYTQRSFSDKYYKILEVRKNLPAW